MYSELLSVFSDTETFLVGGKVKDVLSCDKQTNLFIFTSGLKKISAFLASMSVFEGEIIRCHIYRDLSLFLCVLLD